MRYRWKRLATIGISSLLIAAQTIPAYADTADDIAYLEQQQAAASAELYAVQESINELAAQKTALLEQIDAYDKELVTVIASINLLDNQIEEKKDQLDQTAKDLKKAEKDRDVEYKAMKERIRYIYEEGGNAGWASMLLTSAMGISNILDRASYTQQLYDYDRQELDAYTASVERVDALQKQQTEQKAAMETLKREHETGKKRLEELLAETEQKTIDTEQRMAQATAVAAEYQALIEQQNAAIYELYARQEAERIAAEEAARAAAQAAQQQQVRVAASVVQATPVETYVEEETYNDASYDSGSSSSYSEDTSWTEPSAESYTETYTESYTEPETYSETYEETTSYEEPAYEAPASSGGISGQDVVNTALQYVGNPYVWGGTDPVNGADCSGFIQSIYGQLGYNISRTSYTQMNDGISVSYADAQPGDIINYGHHVAIYMGDNQIVHAADERLGITTSTNATYQPIVDVRRIIY